MYLKKPELLQCVGRDGPLDKVEEFICMLYKAPCFVLGVDRAKHDLFQKGKTEIEMLPQSDELELHLFHANHQASVWLHANKPNIDIPSPQETGGWHIMDGQLKVVWLRNPSFQAAV